MKSPVNEEIELGVSIVYLLSVVDTCIPLTNDGKNQLMDKSWDSILKYLHSNNVLNNFG